MLHGLERLHFKTVLNIEYVTITTTKEVVRIAALESHRSKAF